MIKRVFSLATLLSTLVLGILAYPLYAGTIDPNTFYGIQGQTPLTDAEWLEVNQKYGAGVFAFACILFTYHLFAWRSLKSTRTSLYIGRGLLAAVLSLIPAYIIMTVV